MDIAVTNISAEVIDSPLRLTIHEILPDEVTLVDPDGSTSDGKDYVDLSDLLGDGALSPGESAGKRVYFNNPSRLRFGGRASVYGTVEGWEGPGGSEMMLPFGSLPTSDINGDGSVNLQDMILLSSQWLQTDCGEANDWCAGADYNQDGTVNLFDVYAMENTWMKTE